MIFSSNFGKCPICGKHRSTGNHRKCSKILQRQRDHKHWDTVHANQRKEEVRKMAVKASFAQSTRIEHIQRYQAL